MRQTNKQTGPTKYSCTLFAVLKGEVSIE